MKTARVDLWFCGNCATGYVVQRGRKMTTCWNCGTSLESQASIVDLAEDVNACVPADEDSDDEEDENGEDEDDEGREKYPKDPDFTIPPD